MGHIWILIQTSWSTFMRQFRRYLNTDFTYVRYDRIAVMFKNKEIFRVILNTCL